MVALRVNQHFVSNNIHEIFQSAYRIGHSSETAFTRIHNDILFAIDDNSCVILVFLDLSAAFDTVDHDILLGRLEHRKGLILVNVLLDRLTFTSMLTTRSYTFRLTQKLLRTDALTVSCSFMHQRYYQLDDIKQVDSEQWEDWTLCAQRFSAIVLVLHLSLLQLAVTWCMFLMLQKT